MLSVAESFWHAMSRSSSSVVGTPVRSLSRRLAPEVIAMASACRAGRDQGDTPDRADTSRPRESFLAEEGVADLERGASS
jgi:hypothetical protein